MESYTMFILFIGAWTIGASSIVVNKNNDDTITTTTENSSLTVDNITTTAENTLLTVDNVTNTNANYSSNIAADFFEKTIYNAAVARDFKTAVAQAIALYGRGHNSVIASVVNKLIDNGKTQVFDFAYQLTVYQASYIIRACFPIEIRMMQDMVFVKIISNRYNMALKYSYAEDFDGDRTVFGDPNLNTRFDVMWKFLPKWDDDRVYFNLRTINLAIFMKLGNSRDGDDDHSVYGSTNSDTNRHLWYLKPVRYDGKLLFYIINREFNEPLKLGKSTDWDGDRQAYGNSNLDLNPEKYGWVVEIL